MSENWLHTYLIESVLKKLCTEIHCTTCGAMEFRQGVIKAFANESGQMPLDRMNPLSAIGIAKALAEIKPSGMDTFRLEPPVRCLLYGIWLTIGEAEMERILSDSWAGKVLCGMQEHYKARVAARRAQEELEDTANVQKRRKEKKRLKQEKHQQRLIIKKERDKIWREKHNESE